jgi:hypothetical protein
MSAFEPKSLSSTTLGHQKSINLGSPGKFFFFFKKKNTALKVVYYNQNKSLGLKQKSQLITENFKHSIIITKER